jgi:DNA-binding NarL/FixJ family response regulator
MRTRVLIADDHPLIAEGIERLLHDGIEVIGIVSNGRELLSEAMRLRPDVIVLDVAMPSMNGIEAAMRLREKLPSAKLMFVTQQTDRHYVQAALAAGAQAYVLKQSASVEVRDALDAVRAGKTYISRALVKDLPPIAELRAKAAATPGENMTPREREVLQLVAEGKSVKEVASILKISPRTVEFHKRGVMEALGLRTTAELTRYDIEHGIISVRNGGLK